MAPHLFGPLSFRIRPVKLISLRKHTSCAEVNPIRAKAHSMRRQATCVEPFANDTNLSLTIARLACKTIWLGKTANNKQCRNGKQPASLIERAKHIANIRHKLFSKNSWYVNNPKRFN